MKENITPYKDSTANKKEQISKMFDNVSEDYDRINRIFTFRMDIAWRNNVLEIIKKHQPQKILDVATGTADMPILFMQANSPQVKGIDISSGMLEVGKQKVAQKGLEKFIELNIGDAENLQFEDDSFDAVTISYGVRNFEDLEKGLSEILRVLKPNGLLVILETSVPSFFLFRWGYLFYTKYILPLIGRIFSKDKDAYGYLATSAINFPHGKEMQGILERVGFSDVKVLPQTLGVSSIYKGYKR